MYRSFLKALLPIAALAAMSAPQDAFAKSNSYYYGQRTIDGTKVYVYLEELSGRAEIWIRVKKNQSSNGDYKAMNLSLKNVKVPKNTTLEDVARSACKVKKVVDGAKTIVGCAATAATGLCYAASVPTGGTTAVLCTASLTYTAKRGLKDCIQGISDWVGSKLAGDSDWAAAGAVASVQSGRLGSAIDYAIDYACANVR